ncbi:transposable element Tc3 transposase [Trichonephila clavipes]|nr:transposable element Tc3 transposase [Trichonephila clavipes]
MAINTSQDVRRNGMDQNAIRIRRVNLKSRHMPLSSSMSIAKFDKNRSSRLLLVPTEATPGRFPPYHSCTAACLQEELICCLTRIAISKKELWFQQDDARATIDLLKDTFGDRLISRLGPVNWPPRSCDLTPLDYFLWGYVKSLVYADKPQTLDNLEDNIRRVIADIRPQMLEKSSKIGRPDWTTSEPAVAVLCQKSYLKCNAPRVSSK